MTSEKTSDGAKSKEGISQEIREDLPNQDMISADLSDGASCKQIVMAEEASDGVTSKLPVLHGEAPEGAMDKHGEADMTEQDLAWRWTQDLIDKPSKEIIKLMKEDVRLISRRITVVCSKGCVCSTNFERLAFDGDAARKNTLQNFQTIIERGRCPHMFAAENKVSTLQTTDDSANSLQTEQCGDAVLAGFTAVHIASTFGKVKVVEYIAHALQERIRSPYILGCDEMTTSVHMVDPYYLAVLHRQDQLLGVLTSHISSPMACSVMYKKVLHDTIRLAVQEDNVRSLKILISAGRCKTYYVTHPRDINCALLVAIKCRRMKCIKCLCKKGAVLSPFCFLDGFFTCSCLVRKDEVIKDMLLQADNTVVQEILRCGGVDCRHMLYYAVCYDNTSVTAYILENYKKMLSKKKSCFRLPIIIQAVLNNSTRMIEVLLRSEHVPTNQRYKQYTALNWARALHFDDCALLLENAGVAYDSDAIQNYPPLVMLFGEYITSFYYSKSALILRLLQHGNDVNRESVNGKTALYTALEIQAYSVVRQLLMAGADPFFGRNCLTTFLSLRLLGELLYANVNIFRSRPEESLLHQLLFSFPHLHCHLVFLLKHAHSIPKCNRKLLNSLHDSNTVSRDILDQIHIYLSTPKSLVLRSRDVVRSHFGYKIHDFVRVSNLPSQIKSILKLEGILDFFLSMSFQQ
ncbi:uncharacterized protein LOC132560825 [Ylistrum balloti]|uniref:uncharacterized protein LOC132560825 n=1 Tax=Ylistrum balloti TaxID=509963 RepID=UPI002905BD3A|nr:uncharacterized protein LOC132560825 [Ylistrum balloti]